VHSESNDLSLSDPISNQHRTVHVCSVPSSSGQKSESGLLAFYEHSKMIHHLCVSGTHEYHCVYSVISQRASDQI